MTSRREPLEPWRKVLIAILILVIVGLIAYGVA
jgi:hypothetical protein